MLGISSRTEDLNLPFGDKLRGLLESILSGICTDIEVNTLVRVCHALAIPYVAKRLSKDTILKETLSLNTRDFAYDCVADLFAFSIDREFPHFHAYFAAYPIGSLTDAELIAHLRRLVFSHTNKALFRLYNQVDPALAKVIRNIKLALQEFQSLTIVERFGEQCLAPAGCDPLVHLPPIGIKDLESGLSKYLRGSENIPFMLGRLALYLTEQEDYSRIVTITDSAIAFRSIYARLSLPNIDQVEPEPRGESSDVNDAIKLSVAFTREWAKNVYAEKKHIKGELLDTYFAAIEKYLMRIYSGDGLENSLREVLAACLPEMTTAEYMKAHRSRLEYLSRLTGRELARRLRSNLNH